jgi:hypothetical protein
VWEYNSSHPGSKVCLDRQSSYRPLRHLNRIGGVARLAPFPGTRLAFSLPRQPHSLSTPCRYGVRNSNQHPAPTELTAMDGCLLITPRGCVQCAFPSRSFAQSGRQWQIHARTGDRTRQADYRVSQDNSCTS